MEPATPKTAARRAPAVPLLFVASLGLRALWLVLVPAAIESEGSYYARVGENLAAGRGYVGIREMGLQILYPPLYPVAISLGVRLGLTAEMSGRAMSLLAGSIFPLLAFAVARRLHGARAGLAAGWLAALHPLLIALSACVLTEQTYLTLAMATAWFTLRASDENRWQDAAGAGLLCGLSYLARPEGLFVGAVCVVILLAARRQALRDRIARAAAFAVPLVCVALVYAVPLSRYVGRPAFEAKTAEGVTYAQRRAAGQSEPQIYFSVDSELRDTGISNTPNVEILHGLHTTLGERLRLDVRIATHNLPHLAFALVSRRSLGNPVLTLLALLGLLSAPWTRERLLREGLLLTFASFNLATYTLWPYMHERFIFPLLTPGVVWAGAGLGSLSDRVAALWPRLPRSLVASGVVALLMVESELGVRKADEIRDAWAPEVIEGRQVGAWLRSRIPAHGRVVDGPPTVAYYAGAVLQPLPWTDSATAVRYLDSRRADAIVLRRSMGAQYPYATEWFEKGLPEGRGELLGTFELGDDQAKVYRWRTPDAEGAPTGPQGHGNVAATVH